MKSQCELKKTAILILLIMATSSFVLYGQSCATNANVYSFKYNSKAYEIIKEKKKWTDAASCAVSRGGYLVHIDSAAEQIAIYSSIGSAGISTTYLSVSDGGDAAYIWIGATDKNSEGTWIWDGNNDNQGINFWNGLGTAGGGGGNTVNGLYNNWGKTATSPSEPDDYGSSQDAAAIALAAWPYGLAGQWNDINANNALYYIVEYDDTIGAKYINVDSTKLTILSAASSSTKFKIRSNTSWKISIDSTWLTANKLSGVNDDSITLTSLTAPSKKRTAIVTISTTTGASQQITVSQNIVTGTRNYNEPELTIYPNPCNGIFTINSKKVQSIEVYNLRGQNLYYQTISKQNSTINISEFPKGTYIVKLKTSNNILIKKLIIN